MHTKRAFFTCLALLALALGCSKSRSDAEASSAKPGQVIKLTGAGATFPFPLYSKWMDEYNKLKPNVRINYQSIGSGGGIRQVIAGTVDFGASDTPMTEDEERLAPHKLLHLPVTLGAIAVAYNVPGLEKGSLKLTGETLAAIFLGKITTWNDERLGALNPGVSLPASTIRVVARSDGSGTTGVFTDYLAAVSPEWKSVVGQGKSVSWPVGVAAKGNEGVAGSVRSTPGAIGYVELAYATQTGLSVAELKNAAGHFIGPGLDAVTAAAAGVELPDDTLHASIVNAPAEAAYPISSYSYLLVYEDSKDLVKAQALSEFLWWAVHDGQEHAKTLQHAPLPVSVVAKLEARLKTLKSGGKLLLAGP
jgi:phosphate transport system substrate-binding protein